MNLYKIDIHEEYKEFYFIFHNDYLYYIKYYNIYITLLFKNSTI